MHSVSGRRFAPSPKWRVRVANRRRLSEKFRAAQVERVEYVQLQVAGRWHVLSSKTETMQLHRYGFSALGFCVAAILLFAVRTAGAHAILLESSPALQSRVAGPDVPIKLRFNVRIDAARSRLTLVHSDGTVQTLELASTAPLDSLVSEAKALSAGEYRLRWQVLASDGHLTRGEIPFAVAAP
jgi:copper resistance protein C